MALFRFEKWFTDVLTPERDYLIIFHSLLELFGFRLCFVEINLSRLKEGQVFHLNLRQKGIKRSEHSLSADTGNLLYGKEQGRISLQLPEIDTELNLTPVPSSGRAPGEMEIRNKRGGSLVWKPLYLKTKVSGHLRITAGIQGKREEKIRGDGYTDYLRSGMSPFRIPVRQLYWGRLHSADLDLTFSYALDIQENVCAAHLSIQSADKSYQENSILIHPGHWQDYTPPGISCPVNYKLEAESEGLSLEMEVTHLNPAIISEFAENPNELGSFRKAVLKWITREPRGIKFYSTARLRGKFDEKTISMDDVPMIDEYVRFS